LTPSRDPFFDENVKLRLLNFCSADCLPHNKTQFPYETQLIANLLKRKKIKKIKNLSSHN